jgi:hypothetical protein
MYHTATRPTNRLRLIAGLNVAAILCLISPTVSHGQSVTIDFSFSNGTASIDPITIPNPDTGIDIVVTPSITIDTGGFVGTFDSDITETITDGDLFIEGLAFSGAIDIELESSIEVFGFPVQVTANLTGPLTATQVSASTGLLVDLAAYVESEIGSYDVSAGPLECSDSAFGVFCAAIETGLGVELPIAAIEAEGVLLPFAAGEFQMLNDVGQSTARNEFAFSLPIGDDTSFSADVQFSWTEDGRQFVVPEPSTGLALPLGLLLIASRRRRRTRLQSPHKFV